VISVDTKKKELVGLFANGGQGWRPAGSPVKVNVHDFEDKQLGKAVPYGIYDIGADAGWVNVGTDSDTAAFAVESIRRWWDTAGQAAYPHADRLLITAVHPDKHHTEPPDGGTATPTAALAWDTSVLSHPDLTGMSPQALTELTNALQALHRQQTQDRQHHRRVAAG